MNDNDNKKAFYGLKMEPKPSDDEKLARKREYQRRERKEKLYSYPPSAKNRNP